MIQKMMSVTLLTAIRNNQPTEKVNFYVLPVRCGFITHNICKNKSEKETLM